MFEIAESVDIARPPATVFAFLTDPDRRAEWDRSVLSERLLSAPPVTEGSRIRTRMRVMGQEIEFDWNVTEFVAPQTMAATSTSGTMPTRLRFEMTPIAIGCRVAAVIQARPGGMLRLVEPVVAESARSTLAAGLARAKLLLERGED
ncbi:SRPBCC family protein [Microbacterium sp. SLBN-146]|uniref:SRPBCC family protein n=1 Tax=Microbacterium sp. SLBN-146 TaxID=2768457 RepID=UPI00114FC5DF|nr:SRPBCC family protein [Microbacterium sp. SLBN-146]TQJ30911.1 polyketide cyclase/dehydrase/lipid transport protein [Microbacterium sp. SLBN-146]